MCSQILVPHDGSKDAERALRYIRDLASIAGVRGEGGTSGIGVEGIGSGSAGVSGQSTNGVGGTFYSGGTAATPPGSGIGVDGETAGLLAIHTGVRGRAAPLSSGPNAPYPTPIGGNGNAGVQGLSGDGIGVLGMSATGKAISWRTLPPLGVSVRRLWARSRSCSATV